jgi:hypothetical protein
MLVLSWSDHKKANKSLKEESGFMVLQIDKYPMTIPHLNSGRPKLPLKQPAQKVNLENASTNECC